jgi:hypothetical protein
MRNFFCAILVLISLSACASHYGAARITSIPAGAEVVSGEDGSSLGVTPTTVLWKEGSDNRQHLILRLQKDGYYEKVSSFWLHMRHSSATDAKNDPDLVEVVLKKKGE